MFTKLWAKYSLLWIELLYGVITIAIFIFLLLFAHLVTTHSSDIQVKKDLGVICKERHCTQQIITYEPNVLPETFEMQVASEVRRLCVNVYPDLDSDYILAMVYYESRFQQDAINSKTGAVGLMQILPQWHTDRANNLGVSLYDWKGNILVGCDILNEMMQKKGSMHYAVNFYAGGYRFADYYERTGKLSPYENSLNNILSSGVLEEMEVM